MIYPVNKTLLCEFPRCGPLMTFQHMAYCLVGVRMAKYVVCISWHTPKRLRWIKGGKAGGLTVTANSYQ